MLIVALVLAVIGLVSLVTAVVTSNEFVAWVCIGASTLGVILLIVDAVRERQRRGAGAAELPIIEPEEPAAAEAGEEEPAEEPAGSEFDAEYPEDELSGDGEVGEQEPADDYPEEIVSDEPDADTVSDDEPLYPESAEEAAIHPVDERTADETNSR